MISGTKRKELQILRVPIYLSLNTKPSYLRDIPATTKGAVAGVDSRSGTSELREQGKRIQAIPFGSGAACPRIPSFREIESALEEANERELAGLYFETDQFDTKLAKHVEVALD